MEPSQASGEFSGNNESGWTAYIGSPLHYTETCNDDDDKQSEDTGEYSNNHKNTHGNAAAVDDDDDSMASDASSGPSHVQLLGINSEGSRGSDQIIKHEDNDHRSLFSGKRASKQARKRRCGRKVEKKEEEEEEEEDLLVEADSASSHV